MILSLDASTTSTGYAIFDNGSLVSHGVIRPSGNDVKKRIKDIYKELCVMANKYNISAIYIEDVPLSASINKRVAEYLLLLQGTILSIAINNDCDFVQMEPSNWRRLCGLNSSRKRDEQKEAAINKVNKEFGFDYIWVDSKTDSNTGHSDICEAILIGVAAMNR